MDKEILTMEDAAELFNVSIKTFIKLLKEEKVPARKIGREWRFSRTALINWLSSGDSMSYSSSEGEVKEFFDELAPEWEEISKNYYDESIKNKLIELKILKKNMTVIDLGAGDGYLSRAVARFVKKVVAVDLSAEMLKELEKKANLAGIKNIETIQNDGQDVEVKEASIDIVCANMYLHHIDQPILAINEMFRLLKPGGKVFLADFHEHHDTTLKEKMHDTWLGFNPGKMKNWFIDLGFKNISIETLLDGIKDPKDESANSKVKIFTLTAEK